MQTTPSNPAKKDSKENESSLIKPDPETLHTTDPQEHMKGPVSSIVQDVKEEAEKEDGPAEKK